MMTANDAAESDDPFGLHRFTSGQEGVYNRALAELRSGRKRTHWMWFIFPQIDGLGHSPTTRFYAIKSLEEARAYLDHPVLAERLIECTTALLVAKGKSVSEILGYPDDLKLRSSMTLFEVVAGSGSVFAQVLDRYYGGERDNRTLQILRKAESDAGA